MNSLILRNWWANQAPFAIKSGSHLDQPWKPMSQLVVEVTLPGNNYGCLSSPVSVLWEICIFKKKKISRRWLRIHTFWLTFKIHFCFKSTQFLTTVHVINSFESLGPSPVCRHGVSANYNNGDQTHILPTSAAPDHSAHCAPQEKLLTDTRKAF